MNEKEAKHYENGQRVAYSSILKTCCISLGYHVPGAHKAVCIAEREEAIAKLREICEEFGDNEWESDLHLADIIEKHLYRHLTVAADIKSS